jgi:DNA-binding response OmpR family regulator
MASIVLAEDDVHIIRVVSMWLKQHKHQVSEAPNGKQALQLVLSQKPDLLITDVNMPLMDGITLVKACAAEGLPRLGVVMLTSRCDQADIVDSLKGLSVVFHPKPFSPSRLVAEVESLIARALAATADAESCTAG